MRTQDQLAGGLATGARRDRLVLALLVACCSLVGANGECGVLGVPVSPATGCHGGRVAFWDAGWTLHPLHAGFEPGNRYRCVSPEPTLSCPAGLTRYSEDVTGHLNPGAEPGSLARCAGPAFAG